MIQTGLARDALPPVHMPSLCLLLPLLPASLRLCSTFLQPGLRGCGRTRGYRGGWAGLGGDRPFWASSSFLALMVPVRKHNGSKIPVERAEQRARRLDRWRSTLLGVNPVEESRLFARRTRSPESPRQRQHRVRRDLRGGGSG